MTPIEEMRANAKAEKAAKKARSQILHELMEHAITRMPDGTAKRNGQIILMFGKIEFALDAIADKASVHPEDAYDEKQSQQVLDYLSCVYVGMTQFMKQIGLEDPNGTP